MDTPQSSALFKQLITAVERVGHYLEILRQDLNRHNNTAHANHERDAQQRHVKPLWVNPLLSKYDKSEGNRQTESDRQYRVQNSIRRATWLTLFAVVIYAGVSYLQLRAMLYANKSQSRAIIKF
jgi:hypothetical protein